MNDALIDRIVAEWDSARSGAGDEALEAVRTAIFVEDALGFTLTEQELQPGILADASAIRELAEMRGRD